MEIPEKTSLPPRIALILLLGLCAWAVTSHVGVATSDQAGIRMALPQQLGAWTGKSLLYCSNRDCGRLCDPIDHATNCPACGAPLSQMTWAEKSMLPDDTGLVRKLYTSPNRQITPILATIVLSGNDRSSIHRPEVCQTANGYSIEKREIIRIPLDPSGRHTFDVMVMDMVMPPDPKTDRPPIYTFYAYWFVGKDRETASHWKRMWWMTADRIFRGVSHRWAYISLYGDRRPHNEKHLQTIANFASLLYPQLLPPDAPPQP